MLEQAIQVFRPHHKELRNRTVKVILSIVICTCITYVFSQEIAGFFIAPLYKASPLLDKLVYTNLPEAFIGYIKLSLLIGFVASFPVILYQLWSFVAPGLKHNEKKFVITVVFWGSFLFALGAFFAIFAVLPPMLAYFMSYTSETLLPLPRFSGYLTFIARSVIAFGLAFQIPFLMVMAGKAGLVTRVYFSKKRIYFYAAIVFLAFLLSSGDIMATILLTIPLVILYETGITLMKFFRPNTTSLI